MLKVRVIPCMLFNGFHLVKTISFGQIRNLGNPIQMARVYNSRNVDELIFIDLAATEERREPEYDTITEIMKECFMPVTIGGWITKIADVDRLMRIGADKIAINNAAIVCPEFITELAEKFGSQCVVISIDGKRVGEEHYVFTHRGTVNTGIPVTTWVEKVTARGAGEIFLTSVDQDGTMAGYNLPLIAAAADATTIPVIACGGAGKVQDIIDAVLVGHANAVSLASIFHYGGHTVNSIKERMHKAGIPVRLMRENYET